MTPLARLQGQNAEFRKQIVQLGPDSYHAVGYAASNVSMIVGDGGLIIIDTTETTKAAQDILAEFRKISSLPVRIIVYTHGHRDHISGAAVFAEGGSPEIIASARFTNDLREGSERPTPLGALMARTKRQFGIGLAYPNERINIGVGPGDRPTEGMGAGYLAPTTLIDGDRTTISRLGVALDLIQAPGETPDHMVVWRPDQRILHCGDNYYRSFPNLYAIRGTRYRDFDAWADSVDLMLGLGAEALAPGHTRPLFGADLIRATLTGYRDAIRHIITATIEGMNQGLTPDELVEVVTLPPHLADQPYLQEFYGCVAYAVRAYCAGTLGWFDGNPTSLKPLSPEQEAQRIAQLAGGADKLAVAMAEAAAAGDHQWTLELADRLLRLKQHVTAAKSAKRDALLALADQQMNAPTRNYYLLCAKEIDLG